MIEGLLKDFKMKRFNSYKYEELTMVFVRMSWRVWARFQSVISLELLVRVIGPSLARQNQGSGLQFIGSDENTMRDGEFAKKKKKKKKRGKGLVG
jgi:hypothetical protein